MKKRKKVVHDSTGDSIIGRKLKGFSLKIVLVAKGKTKFPSNFEQYEIKKGGKKRRGIFGECEVIKEKKDKSKIPKNTKDINFFHRCNHCLRGGLIYCECEKGVELVGKLRKLGKKHGMSYDFNSNSKENAWAVITQPILDTGGLVLKEILNVEDIEIETEL